MLPSVLARQVRRGIEDFLRTTFPIHTPHFDGVLERLLDASSREIFTGPYVSVKLPFRPGHRGRDAFPDVPLPFPLPAPGAGVSAPPQRSSALDHHCHRDRFWQDRVLPLSAAGLLLAQTG